MSENTNRIQVKINEIIKKIDASIKRIEQYLAAPDIEDAVKEAETDVQTINQIEPLLKKLKTPLSKEEYKQLHILKQLLIQLQEKKEFSDVAVLDSIEAKLEELVKQ